jgi:hypothetical protein
MRTTGCDATDHDDEASGGLRLITSSNLVGCVTSREAIETLGIDVPDKSLALADTVTHATTRVMNFYIIGVVVVMVAGFLRLHV